MLAPPCGAFHNLGAATQLTAAAAAAGSNVPNKYISQSTWESEEAFRGWTQSQQFNKAHGEGQGNKRPNVGTMLEGPPSPEFFSSVTMTE
jgi:heme-degrading monooxygenase HmoA